MTASYAEVADLAVVLPAMLDDGDVELVLLDEGAVDLALLDAVARIALLGRRCAGRLVLRAESRQLVQLAALTGLVPSVLASEALGQPEPGEELRTEERVDVGDPPA